jgi:predicted amidohydrolase
MVLIHDIRVNTQDPEFFRLTIEQRLGMLEKELQNLNTKMKNEPGYHAPQSGDPPRAAAMLVAPENFFAKDCRNGFVRQFDEGEKNDILKTVAELSKFYSNILIIPGTVSWKKLAVNKRLTILPQGTGNYAAPFPEEVDSVDIGNYAPAFDTALMPTARNTGGLGSVLFDGSLEPGDMLKELEAQRKRGETLNYKFSNGQSELEVAAAGTREHRNYGGSTGRYTNNPEAKQKIIGRYLDNFIESKIPPERGLELAYNTAYLYLCGEQIGLYHKKSDFEENLTAQNIAHVTADGPSVFSIPTQDGDNLNLGIEICLDHNCGVLKKYHETIAPGGRKPDIHLVLSAAVAKVPEHLCVKPDGEFFHSSSESSYREHTRYLSDGRTESISPLISPEVTPRPQAERVTHRRTSAPAASTVPTVTPGTHRARVQNRGNGNDCGGCVTM